MGIAGLLPQLRSITRKAHVSQYRGQTVAVDAYCFLHRGAYCASRELVEGEPTDRHIQYCMSRIDLLTDAGVRPFVVFDGDRLPNKLDEERTRERNREENKARARLLWQQGNKAAAMECYQRAVDILPTHAKQFIEALKRRNIQFIVAPYEADAQMALLALNGVVDVVLTEDSDLLCYGCPTVFFKMDKTGEGEEVRLQDLPQAKELAFQGFGHDLFQEMCVLAGCDFVNSLPGIGIKKAHQHLRRTRCFIKVVRSLRFDGTKIPEGYERRVQRALWTFQHQRVYCPQRRAAVHLHEVVGGDLAAGARVPAAAQLVDNEPDFLGPAMPDDVAHAIAIGDLDPITKLPFSEDLQPCTAPLVGDPAAAGGSQALAGQGSLRQAQCGGGQQPSGRGKSGGQQKQQLGAGNGGNTLTNYKGFLRGLAKPAPGADFKAPRAGSSPPGSQDSAHAPRQQQQQQQEEKRPAAAQQQRQAGEELAACDSPAASQLPAGRGGDMLGSPTEEQWEAFRRRRQKGSGRAPPAAATAAAAAAGTLPAAARLPGKQSGGAAKSSGYFGSPMVAGVRKPTAAPQAAGLLARLRAALQPDEPSIEQLLSGNGMGSPLSAPHAAAASASSGGGEEAGTGDLQVVEEQEQQGGSRARFSVPYARQQPKTPLDIGLNSSPTIDDLLDGEEGAAAAADLQQLEQQQPLGGSPAEHPRPSLRLWMPQRATQQQAQHQQLDLVSPAGPAFLHQLQQQQQAADGGITPGFYRGGGGSEAGSGARPSSLPRRPPAATPCSTSPPRGLRRQPTSAAEMGQEEQEPSPYSGDPIASLSHIAAFQQEAEAALDRAAQVAMASAAQASLRPLPPPAHLQRGTCMQQLPSVEMGDCQPTPGGGAAAKRPLLEGAGRLLGMEKENRLGQQPGSKRHRSDAGTEANPFAAFAFPGR